MAMEQLTAKRLPNAGITPIIPVMYRKSSLPYPATKLRYVDMTRVSLLGRRFYATAEFRRMIGEIISQIGLIAAALVEIGAKPTTEDFVFPGRSAFAGYDVPALPPPFRDREGK